MPDSDHNNDRAAILDAWRRTFGAPPPKHLSTTFMLRATAFEEQNITEGRLSKQVLRRLRVVTKDGPGRQPSATSLKAGANLMREWNGRTYQVEVTGTGFILDGKIYKSLSAIAKHITGAHWSGPRFFGLAS